MFLVQFGFKWGGFQGIYSKDLLESSRVCCCFIWFRKQLLLLSLVETNTSLLLKRSPSLRNAEIFNNLVLACVLLALWHISAVCGGLEIRITENGSEQNSPK